MQSWRFVSGSSAGVATSPGMVLGTVPTPSGIEHLVLVPPGVSGDVEWIADDVEVTETETIAVVGGTGARGERAVARSHGASDKCAT